jgi:hypothetical protein
MSVFTQEEHDALLKAIGQGVLRVKYADKEIEYKSNKDMLEALRMIRADLGIDQGGRAEGYYDKGLNSCGDQQQDSRFF